MLQKFAQSISETAREFSEFSRLLGEENKDLRKLVFYSEGAFHYRYLEDYIDYILANSTLPICYITSDASDPIFARHPERLFPFFIKNTLAAAFAKLDSKVIVLTAPDLENSPIKRAPGSTEHIYAMHGVGSVHQGYRRGAFDHYDSVLCIGHFQVDELRKSEEIYGTRKKELKLTGYPFMEQIHRRFQQYKPLESARKEPLCLIAPTWAPVNQESSIMHSAILPLLEALRNSNFKVWLRPHPEYMRRSPQSMLKVLAAVAKNPNVRVETSLPSLDALFEADILITDHSSIAFDFAFGTERPVLFIDTPTRIDNPEVSRLGIEPIENLYREQLGGRIALNDLASVPQALEQLVERKDEHVARLIALRGELIANWGASKEAGGRYILSRCQA